MQEINLQEHQESGPHSLSSEQRDELICARKMLAIDLGIEPIAGSNDQYLLTPGATIGAFETASCSVFIAPKISIRQLVSLLCFTISQVRFQEDEFDFPEEAALPDALALAFGAAARRCFSRGLFHGYRTQEEALYEVRGRIRFDDQIRRRSGVLLPTEVRYDEFTDDILLNRLVKAAAWRLRGMSLVSSEASKQLAWVTGMLRGIEQVEFPRDAVPKVEFNRLNEHYRGVVTLAQIILRHVAFEANRGTIRASGFVVNMFRFFQEFVTVALRQSLRISEYEKFGEHYIASLDLEGSVSLKPDLTWWKSDDCQFVGDVKYKQANGDVPNADLYQLLAYVTALDLPGGMLIYAQNEADVVTHMVRHSGKRLVITGLDLSDSLDRVLSRVDEIARQVENLRINPQFRSRVA